MRLNTYHSYFKKGNQKALRVIAIGEGERAQILSGSVEASNHEHLLRLENSQSARKVSQPLRVCQIIASAEGGRWLVEQLRDLRDDYGCEVMAVVGGKRGGLIDLLRAENIPYHVQDFEFVSLRGLFRLPLAILELALFFRRRRFDVVHSHLFYSMVVTRIAAWLADVPVRVAMYASPFHLEAPTSLWIDRATCWMDTVLIPSCEKTRKLCREMGVKDEFLPLIYYGPDERRFDPEKVRPLNIRAAFGWPSDTPVVAKVAYFYARLPKSRWIPRALHERGVKGFDDLVRAAPLVLREFPAARFLLVGSGWGDAGEAHMKDIQELSRKLDLEDKIIFTGYREDPNRILAEANVAVQASLLENLGGTIEALLMERPTVVTRVGGMVDSVIDGETGLTVEPSNPADLARGIVQMLRDPDKAHAMAQAGRKLMLERFTLRRTVKDLFETYQRFRSQRRSQPYNSLITLWRIIVGIPVFIYLGFRLLFLELLVPIYLPRLIARAKKIAIRVCL